MILASADWLSISITLLLIVFVIVCLLMSLLILMQRPKQEGLGAAFGSGMTDQMFGARTTNVLQRGTVYLASAFFILTITLAILFARKNERNYSLKKDEPVAEEVVVEEPVAELESTTAPSLEDQLDSSPVNPETAVEETSAAEETAPAEETPAVEETPAAEETEAPAEASTEAGEDAASDPAGAGIEEPATEATPAGDEAPAETEDK